MPSRRPASRTARRAGSHIAPKGKLVVVLSAVPNPDYDRRMWEATVSIRPTEKVVADLRAASRAVQAFITENRLGGGNWSGGQVYDDTGSEVAYVSYNGRVWEPDGSVEKTNPSRRRPASRGASIRDRRAAQQDILGLVFVPESGLRGARGGGLRRARALHREIGGYLVPYMNWQEGKGEVPGYLVGEEMEEMGYDPDYLASLAPTYDATRKAPRAASRRLASRRKNPPQGFRIAGPAVKTMVDGLRISKDDAQKLKDMMDTGAPRILEAADRMMDGYGVERIPGRPGLMCVNMGDAYATTLIYDYKTNRFVVSSWGDIVERQPRRFAD